MSENLSAAVNFVFTTGQTDGRTDGQDQQCGLLGWLHTKSLLSGKYQKKIVVTKNYLLLTPFLGQKHSLGGGLLAK